MKKIDFNNNIHISYQNNSKVFLAMREELNKKFNLLSTDQSEDFTGPSFVILYQMTINFYKTHFSMLYKNFIPLYFSLWKIRVKDVFNVHNMHQDGGIYYFGKNGYKSRMVNVWTNLYKDYVSYLPDSDLGIYIIDNKEPQHQQLYENMAQTKTHFYQKGSENLHDIRQIGDISISYDLNSLKKQYFDYSEGTTIQFNSHLLHGTKSLEKNNFQFPSCDLNKHRISLVSVWVHQRDFNQKLLQIPEEDYEKIYLAGFIKDDWEQIKNSYSLFLQKEIFRIKCIVELARVHLGIVA
jgi:hypothetical protein